ncbi:MAG: LPS export ABC transporter periplasmic protein LptC [Elusimicrobia bacterium CG06_land_8_20_14_3_00_38_11]|nr:MAG: LPS export ABC transporter periplasmic protein LptC [Elusimicrobia bacterium CG06_land_8_20_14_3_00_38_11]
MYKNLNNATESHRKSIHPDVTSGQVISVKFCVYLWLSVASVVYFTSCNGKKVEKFFAGESFPDQIVKNFTMDKYEFETRKWNFFAVRGDVHEKKKIINAKNIKIKFFENNGKPASIVSADKAIIETDTGDMKAEGNVVIFSLLKNTTIFTEALNYNEKSGRVSSDSFIRQEKPDATMTGVGFDADSDLSNITILSNVKVVKK